MCPLKEPQFFSTDVIYERGLAWYQGLFAGAQTGQICGEASTSYTFFRVHPKRPNAFIRPSPMSEQTNARLKAHFKPYNQALAEFLNRDLSHWD